MTPQELQTLVDYHYWAIDRMLSAVDPLTAEQFTRDLGSSFRSVRDTLSHLHSAEWVWLSRLEGASPSSGLPHDRFVDLATVRAEWAATEAGMRAVVGGWDEAGLARVLDYRMLNGQSRSTSHVHIVQHMVNHGTYHRGQVTTLLRQLGAAAPASLDLITFYREFDR